MAQYIDKSAVVAEIEKLQNTTMDKDRNFLSPYHEGIFDGLSMMENFLDALDDESISNLWKDAQGEDLPEIDREVIALVGLCGSFEIQNEEPHVLSYKVVFAHRPPGYWDGTNVLTGETTRYFPKRYDKGGWNIPDVKWWLDLELPKTMEG